MKGRFLQTAMVVLATNAAFCFTTLAMAQSGSTGGVIGKGRKSITGEQEPQASDEDGASRGTKRKSPREGDRVMHASLCEKLPGRWLWFTGTQVVVVPGGTAKVSDGSRGTWTCRANTAVFHWKVILEPIDLLHISEDGKRLSGSNQYGVPVSASRF